MDIRRAEQRGPGGQSTAARKAASSHGDESESVSQLISLLDSVSVLTNSSLFVSGKSEETILALFLTFLIRMFEFQDGTMAKSHRVCFLANSLLASRLKPPF